MAEDADAADVGEDLAELAIVPPNEFTAARNDRAKALRAAKERDRAALVAKLAKPTWTAWALNVLARREPDVLTAWLHAGDALDAALGGGDRDVLREAQQAERAALAGTIERAHAVLAEAGRTPDDQTGQRLTGTLRSAITDAGVRDRLVRGVLDDDVEAPAFGFGFGSPATADATDADVVSLDSARAKRSARGAGSSTAAKPRTATRAAKAAARDDAARAEERAAAEAEAEARRVEAERLAAERTRLEEALRSSERDLEVRSADADAADAAVREATVAAETARAAVEEAKDRVSAARRELDALADG